MPLRALKEDNIHHRESLGTHLRRNEYPQDNTGALMKNEISVQNSDVNPLS